MFGNTYTRSYRVRQSGRLVSSLLLSGVPLIVASELAADAYALRLGEVLGAWGRQ